MLDVEDVSIRFGGLQALSGITMSVREFEIVGIIGPNGAGKTTVFNCITGFYRADEGRVLFRGDDVTGVPPHKKAAMGFGRTFQNVGMVKSSTALENLKTAQYAHTRYDTAAGLVGTSASRREERLLEQRGDQILHLLGLSDIRDRQVGGLPYGVLKLLEVGCALATDPQLLLLDEPSSGMGPEEAHELGERLLTLRRELGLTMLLIEHHVPLVTALCDHVYVFNFGRMLAEGPPAYVKSHPEVVAAYLGGEAPDALAATEEPAQDAVLDHRETLSRNGSGPDVVGHAADADEVDDVDDADGGVGVMVAAKPAARRRSPTRPAAPPPEAAAPRPAAAGRPRRTRKEPGS